MIDFFKTIKTQDNLVHGIGCTPESIDVAERKLGLNFSLQFKAYLMEFGSIVFNGHELTGIDGNSRNDVVIVTERQRKRNPEIPKNWYVVEEAHIDGIVIWQSDKGEVYETSITGEPVKICDSFETYLVEIGIGSLKK